MDAQTLYRRGVIAIRDRRDLKTGHDLLMQSLRLNPNNDQAWLWLTRTVRNPRTRLEYVERALAINPDNPDAQKLRRKLLEPASPALIVVPPFITTEESFSDIASSPTTPGETQSAPLARDAVHNIVPLTKPKTIADPVTAAEQERIAHLMQKADMYLEKGNIEAAIEQWVHVLAIRVDHQLALRNAAGHLWRLHYQDDAWELVQRALDAGTIAPTVYTTTIDMAERRGDYEQAEALREHIAGLPDADEQLLVTVADYYADRYQVDQAVAFMDQALAMNPKRPRLLLHVGELLESLGQEQEARAYFERAVRLGVHTEIGRAADKKLARALPVLTDHERGSVVLALREAVGIALFWLVLAWQDAGLNLLNLGMRRELGVALSFFGGYLLVTAISSPQQYPVAQWLGGQVPLDGFREKNKNSYTKPGQAIQDLTELPIIPMGARYLLGIAGVIILALAFALVFYRSIDLVFDNPPPYLPW